MLSRNEYIDIVLPLLESYIFPYLGVYSKEKFNMIFKRFDNSNIDTLYLIIKDYKDPKKHIALISIGGPHTIMVPEVDIDALKIIVENKKLEDLFSDKCILQLKIYSPADDYDFCTDALELKTIYSILKNIIYNIDLYLDGDTAIKNYWS